ncbi:hypothetical protein [Three spot gourami iridovirus]|nr:hypothetical protein [South American cichlid iridovirus]AVR29818.1 hypothetical protein [Three spot gourami iridovirus]
MPTPGMTIEGAVTAYVTLMERMKQGRERLRHQQTERKYYTAAILEYCKTTGKQQLDYSDTLALRVKESINKKGVPQSSIVVFTKKKK